jgi:hypothetical protein
MSSAGAVAAFFAATVPWIDGTSPAAQQSIVTLLHEIVNNALRKHTESKWAATGELIRGRG